MSIGEKWPWQEFTCYEPPPLPRQVRRSNTWRVFWIVFGLSVIGVALWVASH